MKPKNKSVSMNPFKAGSANYYYYEMLKAEEILASATNPSSSEINDPKAYRELYLNAKRSKREAV